MSEQQAAPIAEVRGAVKRFFAADSGPIAALDGVSLAVGAQEFITLLGPSGCGKTTLLRAISGFEDLDEGEIRIDGRAMAGIPPYRRPVNTVFQSYALFPHLNVADNVGYGLAVAGVARDERNRRVGEALERVGLGGFESRRPRQLSGGQGQRVALARAIINRPKLLLLDEPLSALDRNLRQSMQLELKTLQHGLGICFLFVTHDQEEALTMSDRVVVMDRGHIEQAGDPETLYHRPATRFVAEFIGDGVLFAGWVEGTAQDPVLVTDDGLRLALAPGAAPGQRATLLLRPEHLRLAPDASNGALGVFEARLEQSIFLGSQRQFVCRLASGTSVTVAPVGADEERLAAVEPESVVRLAYSRERPHLIPDSGDER